MGIESCSTQAGRTGSDVWVKRDLHFDEYMRYYKTATSATLSLDGEEVWGREFLHIAEENPYAMRALLSITSLHFSESDPVNGSKWINCGIKHMNHVLPFYREALQNVTEENVEFLYAIATLLVPFVLKMVKDEMLEVWTTMSSSRVDPEMIKNIIHMIIKGFRVIRGTVVVLRPGIKWLTTGPMELLCTRYSWPENPMPVTIQALEDDRKLAELEQLWTYPGGSDKHADILSDALRELRRSFAIVSNICTPADEAADPTGYKFTDKCTIFQWPFKVNADFITLVEQQHTAALVILAHYAMIPGVPGRTEDTWWLDGFGKNIVCAVALALGEQKYLIEWPAQMVQIDLSTVPV